MSRHAIGIVGFVVMIAMIFLRVPVAIALGVVGATGYAVLNGWTQSLLETLRRYGEVAGFLFGFLLFRPCTRESLIFRPKIVDQLIDALPFFTLYFGSLLFSLQLSLLVGMYGCT